MSTSNTHQQSLADTGSETRPSMLERGSYIPWASRFRRYLNRKRENRKWLNKAIDEGLYKFRIFTPSDTKAPRLQKEEDLRGDDLKHYEAEIEEMNLILISIPNDIYNSVDDCTTAKTMWQRFVAEPGEALVSVYNLFAQLMNDLERNNIKFPPVTVNTKFLNCLQPEWLKYVTQVRLEKRLTVDSFDDLFDYLQQFEKLVNASRAKKLEKSHEPLVLVAHTGSSSRTTTPYYVTHPSSVVDYDDDYQRDAVQNNSVDPLNFAMILLARAITQRFSNPINNHLCSSSNTRNQAIVQGDKVNIQSKKSRNDGRNIRRSDVQEEIIEGNNVQNDAGNVKELFELRFRELLQMFNATTAMRKDEAGVILTDEQNDFLFVDALRMEKIEELSANICLMARIQLANIDSDVGPSYDSAFLIEYPKQPKIINNTIGDQIDGNIIFDERNEVVNSCSVDYDNNVQESYELEQLARNAYKEAEKQQIIAKEVQQQNIMLAKQLETYKEKNVELQKTQSLLKRKMSKNEDKYHDTVLDLEAKLKKNVDTVLKIRYANPYTLKKAISQKPKLYDASCLDDLKIHMNVRDTEDILDDATKSQIKMKNKLNVSNCY
ncbi:hypothetical protein Tco_0590664 [Tanacetum coccineum]